MAKDLLIGWALTKDATMKLVQLASKSDYYLILHLLAHWPLLEEHTQHFAAQQLCLQYMATTKGGQLPSTIGTTD